MTEQLAPEGEAELEGTPPENEPPAEPEGNPELEKEARDMGWRPREEWRGDPDDWRDAEDFVRRGKEVLPIVSAENRKLRAELARQSDDFKKTVANLERMSKSALQQQRTQIEAKYEAEKEKAVELGDTKAYRAADKAQKDKLKEFDEANKPEQAKQDGGISPEDEATAKSWWQANPQLEAAVAKSPTIAGAVNEEWANVNAEMFGAPIEDRLQAVKERVVEQFGERIGIKAKSNGSRAPTVEGAGGRGTGSVGSGKQWNKLPAEAKAQADEFIKENGLFLENGEKVETHLQVARERYATDYFEAQQ